MAVVAVLSLAVGTRAVPPATVLDALLHGGSSPDALVVRSLRLPRTEVGLTAGATTVVLTSSSATLDQFRFWQVGALSGRDAGTVVRMLPFLAVGAVLVLSCARGLDALALGDETARALGHRVHVVRGCAALGAALLTAAAVAAAGPIAFVGLVVPHLARRVVRGGGYGRVLPLSALLGAGLLLAADVVGRIVRAPAEVPAGVMTALVGVPVLVALVRRKGAVT